MKKKISKTHNLFFFSQAESSRGLHPERHFLSDSYGNNSSVSPAWEGVPHAERNGLDKTGRTGFSPDRTVFVLANKNSLG